MRLLISVRSAEEALLAARHGADIIDCKEPRGGALGALPLHTVREIVAALRAAGVGLPVSATIGDGPWPIAALLGRVAQVAACGVDWVKVGVGPGQGDTLDALAACGHAVVPVLIADRGIDSALVDHAAALGFSALMADTADKAAGSLFDVADHAALQSFVQRSRAAGVAAGLAGALRAHHADRLAALSPDIAGFRGAACHGGREAALDAARVRALRDALPRVVPDPKRPAPAPRRAASIACAPARRSA